MSSLKIEPIQASALANLDIKAESQSPQPVSENQSPLARIPSRNFENQQWPEDDSIVIDESSNEQGPRPSRINTVLRKTKSQIRGLINLSDKESQEELSKKEIKNSLNSYFKELAVKFSQKQKDDNVEFKDVVRAYFSKKDNQKTPFASDSDNLLNKSLILVDQLTALTTTIEETNNEKLNSFISILTDQLEIHNHKYCETRKQQVNSAKEKNYLQKYNSSTLKIQSSGKWCQISKGLTESSFTIQINSMKKQTKTFKFPSHNYYFVVKGDREELGKTNFQTDSVTVNISKNNLFEGLTIEVYESLVSPKLIGECHIPIEDILENTLFNKNYRVELPIISEDNSEPVTATTNAVSDFPAKAETPGAMSDKEFNEYLKIALSNGKKTDLLRVTFQVNLDMSFVDIIEDIREQRLKNIEIWMEEVKNQSDEQSDYLRFSIAPISTLIFDYELGIRSLIGIEEIKKGRDSSSCGMCTSKCNIF